MTTKKTPSLTAEWHYKALGANKLQVDQAVYTPEHPVPTVFRQTFDFKAERYSTCTIAGFMIRQETHADFSVLSPDVISAKREKLQKLVGKK